MACRKKYERKNAVNFFNPKPKGLEKNNDGIRIKVPGSQRKFVIPKQGCIHSLDCPIIMRRT